MFCGSMDLYRRDHPIQNPAKAKFHCEHGFAGLRWAVQVYLEVSSYRLLLAVLYLIYHLIQPSNKGEKIMNQNLACRSRVREACIPACMSMHERAPVRASTLTCTPMHAHACRTAC